jgi:hypothetical protein
MEHYQNARRSIQVSLDLLASDEPAQRRYLVSRKRNSALAGPLVQVR